MRGILPVDEPCRASHSLWPGTRGPGSASQGAPAPGRGLSARACCAPSWHCRALGSEHAHRSEASTHSQLG